MDGVLKKKLVTRVQSEKDGRAAYASLTPKGLELLKQAAPEHLESVRRLMIDLLSPAEVKAIATAFSKISKNLAEQNS